MQKTLPRAVLMTMFKGLVRAHLDYGDIIYDKATMKHLIRNLNLINRMPVQPYQELLKDCEEKNVTMNQAWNPSNVNVGTGNFAYFIRFSKKINQFISIPSDTFKKFKL